MRRLCATLLLATVALPAAAADLTIGASSPPYSVDPHFYNALTDKALAVHIFDRLVDLSIAVKPAPALATSWRTTSDTVWEFTLRPGGDVPGQHAVHLGRRGVLAGAGAERAEQPGRGFGPMLRAVAQVEATGAAVAAHHHQGGGAEPADRPVEHRHRLAPCRRRGDHRGLQLREGCDRHRALQDDALRHQRPGRAHAQRRLVGAEAGSGSTSPSVSSPMAPPGRPPCCRATST